MNEQIPIETRPTFCAKIYVGLGIEYSGESHDPEKAKKIIQEYVDTIRWCVTVTDTEFIYPGGREPGLIVGIIQYPRFPQPEKILKIRIMSLANKLLKGLDQYRLSVVFEISGLRGSFQETCLITNEDKTDERDN